MRDDLRRKLDAVTRSERRQLVAAAVAMLIAGAIFAYVESPLSISEYHRIPAMVSHARMQTSFGIAASQPNIEAKLDDGQLVRVTGLLERPPKIGSRIVVQQEYRWFSGNCYTWSGETLSQPE